MSMIEYVGSYVPEKIITNDDLVGLFKTDFDLKDWIVSKLGVIERRESEIVPSQQGYFAALDAINKAGDIQIDFIIVNTFFGDYSLPQTSTLIQRKLGLEKAFAFEVNMPCAGPIYTLSVADMMLKSGRYRYGLLVGVDKIRDLIDPEDYLMSALFGEGAGAVIVSNNNSDNKGIVDFYLGSYIDGDDSDENYSLKVLSGKAKYPIQSNSNINQYLFMDGREVKRFIVEKLNYTFDWLLSKHLDSLDELDYIITHQANKVVIERILEKRGVPTEKLRTTIEYLGNTASASVFITIAKHFECFKEENKNILICGMGGGLTWGGILYRT
ncbi:ketoacyl-ACP synthase III [bacterium]|nr:ketoacyl-ACP synthase III [bacterium]